MARYQPIASASWLLGLALAVIPPCEAVAQVQRREPLPASVMAPHHDPWRAGAEAWLPTLADSAYQSSTDRSAARIIGIHTAVGTGAGLLIGLVLSGASVGDHQGSVVLTWTALGAAAGVLSGVVTWLGGRRDGREARSRPDRFVRSY